MNCPNCGQPETARVKECPACKEAYASQDLMALRQLEFLLQETASWEISEALRTPYKQRLEALQSRLARPEPGPDLPEPKPEPVPAVKVRPDPKPAPVKVTPKPVPPPKAAEKGLGANRRRRKKTEHRPLALAG